MRPIPKHDMARIEKLCDEAEALVPRLYEQCQKNIFIQDSIVQDGLDVSLDPRPKTFSQRMVHVDQRAVAEFKAVCQKAVDQIFGDQYEVDWEVHPILSSPQRCLFTIRSVGLRD